MRKLDLRVVFLFALFGTTMASQGAAQERLFDNGRVISVSISPATEGSPGGAVLVLRRDQDEVPTFFTVWVPRGPQAVVPDLPPVSAEQLTQILILCPIGRRVFLGNLVRNPQLRPTEPPSGYVLSAQFDISATEE